MVEKQLWLQNTSGLDVNLSDLGVQVPAFKTVNVYKANPYLTDLQVQKSLESGAIFKRLEAKTLKVVEGYTNPRPHTLDHVKASTKVIDVIKTKSSVVIDTKDMNVLGDEDLGDIADYGFDLDKNLNVKRIKTEDGSVVVEQKFDDVADTNLSATTEITTVGSTTDQSTSIMVKQVENMTNPVGPISEALTPPQQPHLVQPPLPLPEKKQKKAKSVKPKVKKQNDGTVSVEELPKKEEPKADTETYDAQVATKTDKGSVVMKFKEEATDKED